MCDKLEEQVFYSAEWKLQVWEGGAVLVMDDVLRPGYF